MIRSPYTTLDRISDFLKEKNKALIPKKGRGGETASRRSLRRSFSTMLYDSGASRPIVSALMRHRSDGTLSEREYLDRRQLDLRQWLDQLPPFGLPTPPWLSAPPEKDAQQKALQATGTENQAGSLVWGNAEGESVQMGQKASTSVTTAVSDDTTTKGPKHSLRHEETTQKAVPEGSRAGAAEGARTLDINLGKVASREAASPDTAGHAGTTPSLATTYDSDEEVWRIR